MRKNLFDEVTPNLEMQTQISDCRSQFIVLEKMIERLPLSREREFALTKLEEAAMWTNKAITHR